MSAATQPVRLVALRLPPNGKCKTGTLIPPCGLDPAPPYHQIFLQACQQRDITFDQGTFIHLVNHHYLVADRPFQACHPRDLLDQLTDFATYLGEPVEMTVELMDKAARSYFAHLF